MHPQPCAVQPRKRHRLVCLYISTDDCMTLLEKLSEQPPLCRTVSRALGVLGLLLGEWHRSSDACFHHYRRPQSSTGLNQESSSSVEVVARKTKTGRPLRARVRSSNLKMRATVPLIVYAGADYCTADDDRTRTSLCYRLSRQHCCCICGWC